MTPWIRSATVALVLVVWAMAAMLADSHTVLAALPGFFGGLYALAFLWERRIDRAAFPQIFVGVGTPPVQGRPAARRWV